MSKSFEAWFKEEEENTSKQTDGEKDTENGRIIVLPNKNPDIFAIFLVWLTNGNVDAAESLVHPDYSPFYDRDHGEPALQKEVVEQMNLRFFQLAKCYRLGADMGSDLFQDFSMDRIVDLVEKRLQLINELRDCCAEEFPVFASSPIEIHKIYEKTWEGCALRSLLCAHHLFHGTDMSLGHVMELVEFGCYEYISDVFNKSRLASFRNTTYRPSSDKYHEFHVQMNGGELLKWEEIW
jgi:hypothetical protein